jgi:trimeric autotransporter adhesin
MALIPKHGFDIDGPTTAPTAAPDIALGNMSPGTYKYKISYVNRYGETLAGPESGIVTPLTGSVALTNLPVHPTGNVVARNIYRTSAGVTLPYRLAGSIGDNITREFTDITADISLGAGEPENNFASSVGVERGWTVLSRPAIHSIDVTITAAGTNYATAVRCSQLGEYFLTTVPTDLAGIILPPVTADLIGMAVTVKNTSSTNQLNIYPSDPAGQINVAGAGVPRVLPANSAEEFLAVSTTDWQIIGGSGGSGSLGAPIGTPGQLLVSGGTSPAGWSGPIIYNGTTIGGVPTPSNASDIVNKSYVDAVASGLNVHASAQLATTAPLTVLYNNGTGGVGATLTNAGPLLPLDVDTITVSPGQRILVKNQATASQNGVYDVTTVGTALVPWVLTRSADFDNSPPGEVVSGDFVFVESGPTNGATSWVQTAVGTGPGGSIIIGGDTIAFTQISSASSYLAGTGLNLLGNTFNNTGVLTVTGGTTGLTFSPASGNSVLGGILAVSAGGTGSSSGYTAGTGLTLTGTQFSITGQIVGGSTAADRFPQITYNAQGQLTAVTQLPFPIVLDSAAVPTYPTDLSKGVWYGLNTFANAFDATCVTLGQNANTDGAASVAVGRGAGGVVQSVAIGDGAISLGTAGVSIGRAVSGTTQSVTIGDGAISAVGGVSLGRATNGTTRSIAIGDGANSASAVNSIAIGSGAFVDLSGVLSLGPGAYSALSGISIGTSAQTRLGSIAIGNGAQSVNNGAGNSIAIGGGANTTTAPGSVAIGQGANCTSGGSVSIGENATSRLGAVAIGSGASAISVTNNGSVAIGAGAAANNQFCIAIGQSATSNVQRGVSVGTVSSSNADGSSFGYGAVSGVSAVSIGVSAAGSGSSSVAVGAGTIANVASGVAVGASARTNSVANSIVLNATGAVLSPIATTHALAIGVNSASVAPGVMGLTLNGAVSQIEQYSSRFATTVSSAAPVNLLPTSAQIQRFSGTTAQSVLLPLTSSLSNGFTYKIANEGTANITVSTTRQTTISVANTLPVASINVASVAGFAASGTVYVVSGSGVQTIAYTSLTPAVATITSATTGVNPTVFTAVNTFSVGQNVVITGVSPAAYNGTYVVSAATGADFSVAALITGPYVSGGIATPSPSFNGCTGGVGAMSAGGLVRQIIATISTVLPAVQADIEVVDTTGAAGINGWFAPSSPVSVAAPGAVTQLTSLTTGVTLNAAQGKITLFSTLPGASKTRFTVTNSRVSAASVISALSESESAVNGFPQAVGVIAVSAGTFDIIVYNSDANATVAAPIIHFNIHPA